MHKNILLVHNAAKSGVAGENRFEQSNAGVLEEVGVVCAALERLGIKYRIETLERLSELPGILNRSPEEIVFNLVEDLKGQTLDLCYVPALCRAYGKSCTGGDTPCLLLAQDKWQTKAILQAANLPCPAGLIVPVGEKIRITELPSGPYIVKPALSDASEGIDTDSVVDQPGPALDKAVGRIHKQLEQPALIEQFIPNRELNVALLQDGREVKVLAIAEIDFSAFDPGSKRIVDYSAKWLTDSFAYKNTPRIIPARLSEKCADSVRRYAIAAWNALGCQDYARVDFRLNEKGGIFILEVNPNPDISPDAGFAAALTAAQISFDDFVKILIDNASSRTGKNDSAHNKPEMGKTKKPAGVNVRYTCPADRAKIVSILKETEFFRTEELTVAEEVLDDALTKGPDGHYQSFVAEQDRDIVGWVCYGPTPCTVGTFDIYWLAVNPQKQRCGFGAMLMQYAENLIRRRNGRLLTTETSGTPRYLSTRRFYEKMGYHPAGCIKDFYAPADDKIIYTKSI